MEDKDVSLLHWEIPFFLPASELCLVQTKNIMIPGRAVTAPGRTVTGPLKGFETGLFTNLPVT